MWTIVVLEVGAVKALVKAEAKPGLWLQDVPEPKIEADEVLIKVLRTGLCGTDLHIQSWDHWAQKNVPVPMVTGHEFCGEVVEVGVGVRDVAVGDLVSGEGHLVCGRCRNCRAGRRHLCIKTRGLGVHVPGAFAEYVALPASNAWVHKDAVDPDVAAIFDPFGNAVHTALSFPLVGEDVLITGAGPIGVMAAAVALHAGARNVVITDLSEYRLDLARKIGVTRAVNVGEETIAQAQQSLGMREGFDVGMEMSGQPAALRELLANMTHGGKVAMLGLPSDEIAIDWGTVVLNMLTIKGIYGREMFETWYSMSVMLERGLDLTPVITHRFGYGDFERAFDVARAGQCGKVIMDWTTESLEEKH
nr:L-threonine 3-dehydrogenase [Kribbella shirazensis]